ncbi:hypothetical protein BH09SUM1_BH09SUM1_31210 [soil metagenome]
MADQYGREAQRESIDEKFSRVYGDGQGERTAPGSNPLLRVGELLQLLLTMMKDKSWRFPTGLKFILIAAGLYALSPIDLIPDFLFPIGFLDDAGLIVLAARALYRELLRYEQARTR